jgi:hypothetical protein
MKNPGLAHLLFRELEKTHEGEADYSEKTIALNQLLSKLFVELTKGENIQFTTMFARIAFVCHEYKISPALQWRIHQLRKKKNSALLGFVKLSEKDYFSSLKTAAYSISSFCQTSVPDDLKALLPEVDEEQGKSKIKVKEKIDCLRVMVVAANEEEEYLICKPFDNPSTVIHAKYNKTAYNENYNSTIQNIKQYFNYSVTINLVDILVDQNGFYLAKAFVVQPDFMIDVSSIAECFQNFGASAELYLLKKFLPFTYSVPLMLGNIANYFLDELMTNPEVTFVDTFPKVFGLNPLAFATFTDREIINTHRKSQKHFTNLKTIVKKTLKDNQIIPKDCYLEPSFYSEKYGIKGRLDIWYKDPTSEKAAIVELKSGSPFMPNRFGLNHNHYTQTILYDLLVRSVFDKDVDPKMYILYSGVDIDHLKFAPSYKVQQDEAIKLRNDIISIEKQLADLDLKDDDFYTLIDQLSPSSLPKAKGFLARDLQAFGHTIGEATELERLYFLRFVSFTAREHQLAKTGAAAENHRNGLASLWLNELGEKQESFEILSFLKVTDNKLNEENPIIQFKRTEKTDPLANFRQGDIIVFYPYLKEGDNALSNQIFKGSITAIDNEFVTAKLRCKQFNDSLFTQDADWHIEHDMMESSFGVQYKALYSFLQAKKHNRELLLTIKSPEEPIYGPSYYFHHIQKINPTSSPRKITPDLDYRLQQKVRKALPFDNNNEKTILKKRFQHTFFDLYSFPNIEYNPIVQNIHPLIPQSPSPLSKVKQFYRKLFFEILTPKKVDLDSKYILDLGFRYIEQPFPQKESFSNRTKLPLRLHYQFRNLYPLYPPLECAIKLNYLPSEKTKKTEKKIPNYVYNSRVSAEQNKVLRKAIASKDYFLLVGPPGTGKTKFMLAEMVHYLLKNTNEQILLLAYTNRAVDEICEAIHDFAENDYLRIGNKYSSDPRFENRLFSVQTEQVKKRAKLSEIITSHRIFVSTVASIASKSSLLKLKKFDTTIIDEASQILEPMLVGILPHFKRFVLIGDHKQLPAVVVQDKEKSAVQDKLLNDIGLDNRRNSLFERLYNQAIKNKWTWAYDMLSHQGRMHADICSFPSHFFYDGKLKLLPKELPISVWQKAALEYQLPKDFNPLQKRLSENRVLYFNSKATPYRNLKTNINEAEQVGKIIAGFHALYLASEKTWDPTSIGVITPFRAQIAQVRHVLSNYNQGYETCSIDTVERYQGGARDIIIISLCLNSPYQLESIISLSDDGKVDRKLNVALTRARQHLIIVGNESLMRMDERYANLIDWIQRDS